MMCTDILYFSQVLQSDPFQMVKWPFLGLGDLELMKKVTLKNQEIMIYFQINPKLHPWIVPDTQNGRQMGKKLVIPNRELPCYRPNVVGPGGFQTAEFLGCLRYNVGPPNDS